MMISFVDFLCAGHKMPRVFVGLLVFGVGLHVKREIIAFIF